MVLPPRHDDATTFDVLDEAQCLWLLDRTYLGRVAVTVGALPAVFPVNYAMHEGAIYFLTGAGTELAAACRGAAVAFQIDSVDFQTHSGWSVQAVGIAEKVHEPEAAELLKVLSVEPWVPEPHNHLVRITPTFVSGRRIGAHRPATR